ncbi:MAG: tetratricopeptide repeat protein [Luteolibacter sp.]
MEPKSINSHKPENLPSFFQHLPVAIICAWLGCICVTNAHEEPLTSLQTVNAKLTASPHNSSLHLRRASLLLENDQPAAALEAVARIRELGNNSLSLSLIEAKALLALDRPEESLAILADCQPTAPLLSHRARALHASGKTSEAIEVCRTLLATAPDPDIAFLAAGILVETNDTPAAIRLLDSAFPEETRPSSIELQALDYEIFLKSWDNALTRIDRHIVSSSRPEPWLARRADLLTIAGRSADAMTAWQDLLTTIRNLPPSIRGSHAMLQLAQKARAATDSSPPSSQ